MSRGLRVAPDEVADLPVLWRGDVLVVGGGSAGCAAATAAARSGAATLLVESGGFLGGTGARVLDTFYGFYAPGADGRRVVGGIGWQVCERLTAAGAAFERPNTYGAGTGVTYEPEALKVVWDDVVDESGARVLLHTLVTAAVLDGERVTGVVAETRRGAVLLLAGAVVDATGDAEVAWRAGSAVDHAEVGTLQPATATFRVGGVADAPASTAAMHAAMRAAAQAGRYDLPRLEGSLHVTCLPGVRHANMTRVSGLDLTDPWQLSAAEREGRRQVQEYVRFLVAEVEGYAGAHLLGTSTRIGVRETRRLVGRYVLTRGDVLAAADFPDGIARCGAPVEDHAHGSSTRWEYVGGPEAPTGRTYAIPYRCLLPADVDGLLVAGRCLSATHDAHASVRSMGQCMAMGEAAGTAAALAVQGGVGPADVDVPTLRRTLEDHGALL